MKFLDKASIRIFIQHISIVMFFNKNRDFMHNYGFNDKLLIICL